MDNFMLLEEDDDEDQNEGKKQKDKDKKNNSNHNSEDELERDNNEKDKKNQKKSKKKKRDQGGNETSSQESSECSDKEVGMKCQQQRSRENTNSVISAKEDPQNHKEKRGRKNSIQNSSHKKIDSLDSNKQECKESLRHFADDEDEDIHKLLRIQRTKSVMNPKIVNNAFSRTSSDNSHNIKIRASMQNNIFSEDKYFAEKTDIKTQPQALFEQKNNKKIEGNLPLTCNQQQLQGYDSQQQQSNNGTLSQINKIEKLDGSSNQVSQFNCNNIDDDVQKIQNGNQKEQKETQSLDIDNSIHNRKRKKSEKLNNKDANFNSVPSDDTVEQKMHKSDDYGSNHFLNSLEPRQFNDLRSLQPDFLNNFKPFILNINASVGQTYSNNTLSKLGIQKDLCISEKNESQKTGVTKNSSGAQTLFNQSSGGVGNPTLNSSIENIQGGNKVNQNSNNAPSMIQIASSSSSSDESSDNEPAKLQLVHKRSKGDGGASNSSNDSDNNSKVRQKQTPQKKFKKETSTKDGKNINKDKVNNNNTPQIKPAQKKKEVSKEKSKLRREDREQQLDQLLRDMGINKKLIINYSELDFGKKIGEGSYGQVFKGVWQKTQVAIKQFGKQNSKFHLRKVQDFISEVRVINNLRHPNIVLYMGVCLYQSQYFMITEYLQEGSLFDHLHDKKTAFTESKQIDMIEDMALGMVYLHGRKVMHCDLKSSNVLIDENWNVKLCDFGLSRIKSTLNKKKDERKTEGLVGTPQWMAPEIMRREQYQEHSDVYSFGMIMWEIATRQIPYRGLSHQQIYGTVGYDDKYQVEIPKRGIPRYLNLMKKCLKRNPTERPTFQEIVEEIQLIKKDLKDNNKKQVIKEIIRFFG